MVRIETYFSKRFGTLCGGRLKVVRLVYNDSLEAVFLGGGFEALGNLFDAIVENIREA